MTQEQALKPHFVDHPARNVDAICAYILAEYGQSYSAAGCAKLMRRLGFLYKKAQPVPAQADEAKQAAFIAGYEALMTGLRADEMVAFSDAVHPEHQSRPRAWLVSQNTIRPPSRLHQDASGLTSKARLIWRPSSSPLWKVRRLTRRPPSRCLKNWNAITQPR